MLATDGEGGVSEKTGSAAHPECFGAGVWLGLHSL